MDVNVGLARGRRGRPVVVGAGVLAAALVGSVVLAACSGTATDTGSGAGSSSASSGPKPAGDPAYRSGTGGLTTGSGGSGAAGQPLSPGGSTSGSGTDQAAGAVGAKSPEELPAGTGVLTNRSVVRTASVTVRVDDVLVSSAKASSLAEALGGFVAGEKTQASPDQPTKSEAVVTLRVPADRMPALLSQLRGLGTLLSEDQSADDVTGQVIDVAARIAAQKASVARVQVLMNRANTLGQVVQIEGELTRRQAALESLQGQAAALADQTTLATVTATILGPKAAAAPPKHTTTSTGFGAGLGKGWHAFTVAGTWLLTTIGVLLPFALLLAPFAAAGYAVARRRTRTGPTAPTAEPPPAAA